MEVKTLICSAEKNSQDLRQVVDEKLFKLSVNGRELMGLVASPHQPEQLIVGFLYLQGLITSREDIASLGICDDSGQVIAVVSGEIPEKLSPTLTSGCGGGVSFDDLTPPSVVSSSRMPNLYKPEFIIDAINELFDAAKQYTEHGGIHSAALCDNTGVLLHAEDIGRHNTIDRVAGKALQQRVDSMGKLLLTSGRVSSEMVVKAVRLGVSVLASRTSPTSMAVEICEKFDIGLAGYVRGGKMEIFANPDRFGV